MAGHQTCPGCDRRIGARLCCAACTGRIPAELAAQLQRAQADLARAEEAIRVWLREHPAATPRDIEVLRLVADGLEDTAIANKLGVPLYTVKDRLRRMSKRWGCRGRAHLVGMAFRLGYIEARKGVIR